MKPQHKKLKKSKQIEKYLSIRKEPVPTTKAFRDKSQYDRRKKNWLIED